MIILFAFLNNFSLMSEVLPPQLVRTRQIERNKPFMYREAACKHGIFLWVRNTQTERVWYGICCYCHGVVSHKAFQALRPFLVLYAFIAVFTVTRHRALSRAKRIESATSLLIFLIMCRLLWYCSHIYVEVFQVDSPLQDSEQNCVCIFRLSHACYTICPSHYPWFGHPVLRYYHSIHQDKLKKYTKLFSQASLSSGLDSSPGSHNMRREY